MKIKRSVRPAVQRFLAALRRSLKQKRLVRKIVGGIWVNLDGSWEQCDVLMTCKDGSRVLMWQPSGLATPITSFHESHNSVEAIEVY